jgi:hypothetical protein
MNTGFQQASPDGIRGIVRSMKLVLLAIAAFAATCTGVLADPAPQALSVVIGADGARTHQLAAYDPSVPIAVSVSAPGESAVNLVATAPDGSTRQTPLTRTADGRFTTVLHLDGDGAYTVALQERTGAVTTQTTPFTLTAATPPPDQAPLIGVATGSAIFVLGGGAGFAFLRRLIAQR